MDGHLLLVKKTLNGLYSSGTRCHHKVSTCKCAEEFFPCKAEPNIWRRLASDHYKYVPVYVDDLAFVVDNPPPQQFVDTMCEKQKIWDHRK